MTARRKKAGRKAHVAKADAPSGAGAHGRGGSGSGNVGELAREAEALAETGEFDAAADMYARAAERVPRNVDLLERLAEALLEAGRPDEAQAALERAVKLAPAAGFEKYMYLAQLMGSTRDAVDVSRKGVDVLRREKAADTTTPARRAELEEFEVSALCGIAETLLTVIEKSNDQAVANELDGQVELAVGEALAVCRPGTPGEVEAALALANLRLSQGRSRDARAAMERVIGCMSIGLSVLSKDDLRDEDIVEGLAALPQMHLRTAIGKQLVEVELWEDAIAVLSSTLFECDFNVEVLYLLALASMRSGDPEQALSFVERTRSVLSSPDGYAGHLPDSALGELEAKIRGDNDATTTSELEMDRDSTEANVEFSQVTRDVKAGKTVSPGQDDSMRD